MIKRAFILKMQVKYVQYIIVTRDAENLGISRKEVIQVVLDIGQMFFNKRITWMTLFGNINRLQNMNRHGWVTKAQAETMERSHICVSQQYRWNMMIEAEW